MLAWRATAFVNFTHRIGFRMSEPFHKIDEDFGGSISWDTQPNCRWIFMWRGGGRQKRAHPHCRSCAGLHRLHLVEEEEKGRKVKQEVEREFQGEETAHLNMSMKMGWLAQTWATVRVCVEMNDKTTWESVQCAQWMCLQVCASWGATKARMLSLTFVSWSVTHTCRHWHSSCALSPTRT